MLPRWLGPASDLPRAGLPAARPETPSLTTEKRGPKTLLHWPLSAGLHPGQFLLFGTTSLKIVNILERRHLILLPDSGLAARGLKAKAQEAAVGRKESLLHFRGWPRGERADSCPKASSPPSMWARAFKGGF